MYHCISTICTLAQLHAVEYNFGRKDVIFLGTARTRANNKWNAKAYDRINLTVDKGRKDLIKAHAESKGESVNGFINRAINETMEREKEG